MKYLYFSRGSKKGMLSYEIFKMYRKNARVGMAVTLYSGLHAAPLLRDCTSTHLKLFINESSSLSCRVRGWPPPNITLLFENKEVLSWLKGVTVYKKRNIMTITIERRIVNITVERMSQRLAGTYTFVAENQYQRTKRSITVALKARSGTFGEKCFLFKALQLLRPN